MMRLLAVSILVIATACAPGTTAAPVVAPQPKAEPPADPGKIEAPPGMRVYHIVMLRRGPAWTAESTPESKALGKGHMEYIGKMAAAGKLRVAGPFLGQTDSDDFAGIYVFDTASVAETRALAEQDPAVAAGRFVPEYLIWMAAKGLSVDEIKDQAAAAAAATTPNPCTGPERTHFDFWVGDWEVANPKGDIVGSNLIEKDYRGCTLVERWRSAKGSGGMSTNYYDAAKKRWVQHWVDGTGGNIQLEGGLEGSAMALAGTWTQANGTSAQLRGTWTPLPDGRVRQYFEWSSDGGKTWKPWFDGYYKRRGD